MIRVNETRCSICGGNVREERFHIQCEDCGVIETLSRGGKKKVSLGTAVIQTTLDFGGGPKTQLPKAG